MQRRSHRARRLVALNFCKALAMLLVGAAISMVPFVAMADGVPPDGQVPADCADFVTGGGFFSPAPLGPERASFDFNAGYRQPDGALQGHFNYLDHNSGMRVSSTSIDFYTISGLESRIFGGEAVIDGESGHRYQVEVVEAGEPGRDDRIIVTLDSGYQADSGGHGHLTDEEGIQGGNIQLHQACTDGPNGPLPQ